MRDESGQFGCYLSEILTWQPKTDRDRERPARERAKRVINNYVIFLIVVVVTHSLSLTAYVRLQKVGRRIQNFSYSQR